MIKELAEIKPDMPDISLDEFKFGSDIFGKFRTIDIVPTYTPRNYLDQIIYYSNAGTKRIYIYDTINHVWSYAALT